MPSFRSLRFSTRLFALGCVFLLSIGSTAAELTPFPLHEPASRGQFVRNAVEAFGTTVELKQDVHLPYRRVPKQLVPYVQAAYEAGALTNFGDTFLAARPITRGEALEVVINLLNPSIAITDLVFYTDAAINTSEQVYVQVAVQEDWMQPLRDDYFGWNEELEARDAIMLIERAFRVDMPGLGERPAVESNRPEPQQTFTVHVPKKTSSELDVTNLIETASIIDSHFYKPEDIAKQAAMHAAIAAYVAALGDPHTTYLEPVEAEEFTDTLDGELSGIGAQVEDIGGIVTIVSPLIGSPAERAQLLPGDQILEVDGEDIVNIGFMTAIRKIRGPKGTTVILTIRRNGATFPVEIVRDIIETPEMQLTWHGDVAHIQLFRFGLKTQEDLRELLTGLRPENGRELGGVILDLRNNPGGYLDTAVSVSSNFLPKGTTIARFESRAGTLLEKTNLPPVVSADTPVVVLINKGSASSSEIVAGAFQDYGRATIVGEKSFGKGTAQTLVDFTDGSSLKMTTAEWFTPHGHAIDSIGITPDIEVPSQTDRDEQFLRAKQILE